MLEHAYRPSGLPSVCGRCQHTDPELCTEDGRVILTTMKLTAPNLDEEVLKNRLYTHWLK